MNKIQVHFIAFVLLLPAAARAQEAASGYVEVEYTLGHGDAVPEVNVYGHGPIAGKFGWTLWSQTSSGWGETLSGLTFEPAKWIDVSASLGLERDDSPFRAVASIYISHDKLSFLSIQEKGGSGHWQQNIGSYQLTEVVAVGILQQTDVGTGPYVLLKVGKISFWGSYAPKDNQGLATLRFNF